MAVQGLRDNTNKPFITGYGGIAKRGTFARDADRDGDIAIHTVVTQNKSSGLWYPYTDLDAKDGTQHPRGIVMATVTEAALIAGDVENVPILKGNAIVDEAQIVLENDLELTDVVIVPTNNAKSIEDELNELGIFFADDNVDTTELAGVNL
jgi:hypothetical protein